LGIHKLSVGERLELIEQIWNSLPEQIAPQDIPEWHLTELARRLRQKWLLELNLSPQRRRP